MAYAKPYDNTNTGLLSKNPRKEKETHADYKGSINVDGQEYWLSAWIKSGREGTKLAGQKYLSLSVEPKEDRPRTAAPARAARPAPVADSIGDDDIPF